VTPRWAINPFIFAPGEGMNSILSKITHARAGARYTRMDFFGSSAFTLEASHASR